MTYFPDLSKYEYHHGNVYHDTVNVGWLDVAYDYPRGDVPDLFIERLWAFCRVRVRPMRGIHVCQFCAMPRDEVPTVQRGEEVLELGWAEIRVFGRGKRIYAAPNLVYHYIVVHNYRPPEEFIQAVLTGSLPGSLKYEEAVWSVAMRRS